MARMKVSQDDYDFAIDRIENGVWSKQEAAEFCGVSPTTVTNWCKKEGILPGLTEPGRQSQIRKLLEREALLGRKVGKVGKKKGR